MGIKEYRASGGNRALLNDYHRRSDSLAQWQINFLPYEEQNYGFDYLGSGSHGIYSGSEYYPYLSGNYDLRYKSVECDQNDKVIVDFGSYPEKDSVIFKDKYGVKLKVSKGNILNFSGVTDADTNYIYAYRGDEKIGKLSVNTYKKKSYKVVLVSVNGAKLPDIISLQDSLNKYYKQSVVSFEVDTVNFYLPELTSFSHGGSPWHSVYNDDQKRVLRAYNDSIKDGVYYLFFIDNVTDKKDGNGTMVSGYMPRGYNCGFIYDGGSPHTIAHELGHGIAGLEHVFENSKSSGKTKNLMDYSSGEELWHFQWDAIQDPSRVLMKWNKDESEGEDVEVLDKDAKYVIYIFSPYISQKVMANLDDDFMSNAEKVMRVKELIRLACSLDFEQNVRNNLLKELTNLETPNFDNLKTLLTKANKIGTIKINHQVKNDNCILYLLCGDADVDGTENFSEIGLPYFFIRKEIKVPDYIDNISRFDFTQFPGQWVLMTHSKRYMDKQIFTYQKYYKFFDSRYQYYYTVLMLKGGVKLLVERDYKYEESITYKIQFPNENIWYEISIDNIKEDCLCCELKEIVNQMWRSIGKYSGPTMGIIAAVVTIAAIIGSGGTALPATAPLMQTTFLPLLTSFAISSATYSIASNSASIILYINDKDKIVEKIPNGYLNATIGVTIIGVDKEGVINKDKLTGYLSLSEGVLTFNYTVSTNMERIDNIINIFNTSLTTIKLIKDE